MFARLPSCGGGEGGGEAPPPGNLFIRPSGEDLADLPQGERLFQLPGKRTLSWCVGGTRSES